MNRALLYVLTILCSHFIAASQTRNNLFSEAIATHLTKYNKKINKAYEAKDYERAEFMFDSLVKHHLRGTYLDNFKVDCLAKSIDCFDDYKKPMFLVTYASWCVPTEGEIPAINELAKKYKKDIDFVVLFWDKKTNVRKSSKKYNKYVDILYVDELENSNDNIVKKMKHSLGFPTSFYLGSDKKIIDIKRTVFHPLHISYSESYNLNYNTISQGLSLLLSEEAKKQDQPLYGY